MEELTSAEFRQLLTASLAELENTTDTYQHLLTQLKKLEQDVESSQINKEALEATEQVFDEFPHLGSVRAAALSDDPLESTRKLSVEIRNRVVILHRKRDSE